jgi:probable rRNA maturation factor
MVIYIEDRQHQHRVNKKEVEEKAKIVLNAMGVQDGELSLLIVDDDQMAELNKTYLGREGPTNVIAFPMRQGPFAEVNANLLGDVAISMDTALREAETAGVEEASRFDQLLIHGILHLLGYDHENTPNQAEAMQAREEALLRLLQSKYETFE